MRQSLLSFVPRTQVQAQAHGDVGSAAQELEPPPPNTTIEAGPSNQSSSTRTAAATVPKSGAGSRSKAAKGGKGSASAKAIRPKAAGKPTTASFFKAPSAGQAEEVNEESETEAIVPIDAAVPKRMKNIPVIVIDDDSVDEAPTPKRSQSRQGHRSRQASPATSRAPEPQSFFRATSRKTAPARKSAPWPTAEQVHVRPSEPGHELAVPSQAQRSVWQDVTVSSESSPFNFIEATQRRSTGLSQQGQDSTNCFYSSTSTLEAALMALASLAEELGLNEDVTESDKDALSAAYADARRALQHPASCSRAQADNLLWTHAHRPQRASHILGPSNRASSAKLRDWLRELMLVDLPSNGSSNTPGRSSSTLLKIPPNKRQKMHHLNGTRSVKASSTQAHGQRTIQRRVDKKGEREKKLKAARRARRDWSGLADSDDDIADFVVDDFIEPEYESSTDISDWVTSEEQDIPAGEDLVIRSSQSEDPIALLSTPQTSQASDRLPEPGSSSPVIAPGRPQATQHIIRSSIALPSPRITPEAVITTHSQHYDDHLTNCILLTGPSGSGKTAAVYACAAELGYEVFELFAGMGKRTGKELEAAVGAVAANHMVGGGGKGGGASGARSKGAAPSMAKDADVTQGPLLKSMFGVKDQRITATQRRGTSPDRPSTPTNETVISIASSSPTLDHQASTGGPTPTKEDPTVASSKSSRRAASVRQSIILIEEADLLYEDDKGFWSALIDLIGRSRRPVVITVNDLSAVPADDLPIQEVLEFAPASAEEVSAYLRLRALQERHILSGPDATRLYTATRAPLSATSLSLAGLRSDTNVRPSTLAAVSSPERMTKTAEQSTRDVRAALAQLQFWCSERLTASEAGQVQEIRMLQPAQEPPLKESGLGCQDLTTLRHGCDMLSFVDAYIHPTFQDLLEIHEPDAYHPLSAAAAHDQLQHERCRPVLKPPRREEEQVLPAYTVLQCQDMAAELTARAQRSLDVAPPAGVVEELSQRLEDVQRVATLFGVEGRDGRPSLVPPPAQAWQPSRSVLVDYAPAVRSMVRLDDIEASRHGEEVRAAKAAAAAATAALAAAEGGGTPAMNTLLQLRLTRTTRNSQQTVLSAFGILGGEVYPRWLDVGEEALAAARAGGFPEIDPELMEALRGADVGEG